MLRTGVCLLNFRRAVATNVLYLGHGALLSLAFLNQGEGARRSSKSRTSLCAPTSPYASPSPDSHASLGPRTTHGSRAGMWARASSKSSLSAPTSPYVSTSPDRELGSIREESFLPSFFLYDPSRLWSFLTLTSIKRHRNEYASVREPIYAPFQMLPSAPASGSFPYVAALWANPEIPPPPP
jgi:hypothetical protein